MNNLLTFTHSGALGDLLYSLPMCITVAKQFNYIITINKPGNFNIVHPAGHVLTTGKLAEFIKPLLEFQPYINNVEIMEYSEINYNNGIINLDSFRDIPCNFSAGYIPKYYFYLVGNLYNYDFSKQCIVAGTDERTIDKILIFRSSRYHNPLISYKFLEKYKSNIIFIGLDDEYKDFKNEAFTCEYIKVNNALEAANLINSAKLTIGNQTFLFAIAELLKVPRLIESCTYCPNVLTIGGYANEIIFQQQFEQTVNTFLK